MDSGRGYFGIGIFNGKTEQNIGTLWRSASILGASFIFTVGRRYSHQCSDTAKAPKHIPLFNYPTWDDFIEHIPSGCPIVAVELDERSIPLEGYGHLDRCIYLLGAEDNGIPQKVLARCKDVVQILGDHCYNVAVAGSIVMYDRAAKRSKQQDGRVSA
ncbi:MAG: RNA methyltransferase [Alphaproteobacteria bacterium]|nr:RNA methyltransferase [Alphaproteobacteria bacterium]